VIEGVEGEGELEEAVHLHRMLSQNSAALAGNTENSLRISLKTPVMVK